MTSSIHFDPQLCGIYVLVIVVVSIELKGVLPLVLVYNDVLNCIGAINWRDIPRKEKGKAKRCVCLKLEMSTLLNQ